MLRVHFDEARHPTSPANRPLPRTCSKELVAKSALPPSPLLPKSSVPAPESRSNRRLCPFLDKIVTGTGANEVCQLKMKAKQSETRLDPECEEEVCRNYGYSK